MSLTRFNAVPVDAARPQVCERTASDKKGGHLARRAADGKLVLRESAQCAKEDEAAFQDISTHRFFNTNNLWVRLDRLQVRSLQPAM